MSMSNTSLNRMLREVARSVIMNKESKEMLNICCTEFVSSITTEAKAVSHMNKRKAINGDHILQALDKLGLEKFILKIEAASGVSKFTKKRKLSTRLEDLGIPEEELLKIQQGLFAKAKEEQAKLEQEQALLPQPGCSSAKEEQAKLEQEQALLPQPGCSSAKEEQAKLEQEQALLPQPGRSSAKKKQAKLEQEQALLPQPGCSSAVDLQQPYCGMSSKSQDKHI